MAGPMHEEFKKLLKASHAVSEGCVAMMKASQALHGAVLAFEHDFGARAAASRAARSRSRSPRASGQSSRGKDKR